MGKNKVPKTPEERAAREEIMAAKRNLKVRKKETQCLKVLQKAAKKAKDLQLGKLRRRLKPFILAREGGSGHVDKPTEGSSSGGETKDAVTLLPGKSEADKSAPAKQEAPQEQDDSSKEEEDSSEDKSESESRKESDSSSDEEADPSSDEEADGPPTPAPSQQEARKKGNKRKQMEMQMDAAAEPGGEQAIPKKKRKGGNGPGKVLPAEDTGHNLSEDATPQDENGQLIEASNSELQGSMKKRDPLKYETSNEDAIRRQMEVGKQVSNRAVAILAGQKLGMFLVKQEVPDLRLDPDFDEAAVQTELRPFAERMLAHAAMKRALEECKVVVDKVHAVQERWETRGERREAKAARRAAAQAERAAQGLSEKNAGGTSQNAKQRKEAARKAKREARLKQKEITREKRRKEFKLQQAAISRGDGSVKYLKPYQQKRIAKEQAAQGVLPKRNKAKYGGGKGGKRDKKKGAGAPAEATRPAEDQKSGDNAGLHPSWAAKKQQSGMMGHLTKAQGKKVVFD